MLIGNVDRRLSKVNLFTTSNGFILIDHEQAFPFSRPYMMIGGYPPSWEFVKKSWSRDHILYPNIKGKSLALEIEEFISDLVRLNDDILVTIEEQIPVDWQPDLENIANYLANTRQNANSFQEEFTGVTSMNTRIPFKFSVLKYIHDTFTGEFLNVWTCLICPGTALASCQIVN